MSSCSFLTGVHMAEDDDGSVFNSQSVFIIDWSVSSFIVAVVVFGVAIGVAVVMIIGCCCWFVFSSVFSFRVSVVVVVPLSM